MALQEIQPSVLETTFGLLFGPLVHSLDVPTVCAPNSLLSADTFRAIRQVKTRNGSSRSEANRVAPARRLGPPMVVCRRVVDDVVCPEHKGVLFPLDTQCQVRVDCHHVVNHREDRVGFCFRDADNLARECRVEVDGFPASSFEEVNG